MANVDPVSIREAIIRSDKKGTPEYEARQKGLFIPYGAYPDPSVWKFWASKFTPPSELPWDSSGIYMDPETYEFMSPEQREAQENIKWNLRIQKQFPGLYNDLARNQALANKRRADDQELGKLLQEHPLMVDGVPLVDSEQDEQKVYFNPGVQERHELESAIRRATEASLANRDYHAESKGLGYDEMPDPHVLANTIALNKVQESQPDMAGQAYNNQGGSKRTNMKGQTSNNTGGSKQPGMSGQTSNNQGGAKQPDATPDILSRISTFHNQNPYVIPTVATLGALGLGAVAYNAGKRSKKRKKN